ncbi:MAG: ABC transporter ATP-binding protein/permease [Verrucomicrobiaceae bacterium]|nr:ABC transporter ATP-binding protein/permease [Verrucomicrobiaceae bacterium]
MNHNGHRSARETWQRFRSAARTFLASADGRQARWWFALLVTLLLGVNGLNVINSYVGRDFISAIENKNTSRFILQAWLYAGVFMLSTLVAVFYRFAEERLALLWRDWQTRQVLDRYLRDRTFYQLHESGALENPDQRIAEDIRAFTTTTLSFLLMTLNASFTVLAFAGVLWTISPRLFVFAVCYALAGSAFTVLLGKRLVGLNDKQLDKEANFRAELMHVREHAESLALLDREDQLRGRLHERLRDLVRNARNITVVNRNLGFFTTGYNYFIQIIPALIVAPFFIRGEVEFGVITQSAMAFAQLMGAFSLIVTQFQSISTYAAVVTRLDKLVNAIDDTCSPQNSPIQVRYEPHQISYQNLTLQSADGTLFVKDLNLTIPRGSRVLVASTSGHAKQALFKATAGLSCDGSGVIVRPEPESMMFLPERPYLPAGSLRSLLLLLGHSDASRDAEVRTMLSILGIEHVIDQAGGLDSERDWNGLLSLSDQAMLAVARVMLAAPEFVFVDRLTVTFDSAQGERVLSILAERQMTVLVLGKPGDTTMPYDATLTIERDGSWSWSSTQER